MAVVNYLASDELALLLQARLLRPCHDDDAAPAGIPPWAGIEEEEPSAEEVASAGRARGLPYVAYGSSLGARTATPQGRALLVGLLAKHGYVVLAGVREPDDGCGSDDVDGKKADGVGRRRRATTSPSATSASARDGHALYRRLERELLHGFFLQPPTPSPSTFPPHGGGDNEAAAAKKRKEACVGGVYVNERGVPMWRCGYEATADGVREAFRVHAHAEDERNGCGLAWPTSSSPLPRVGCGSGDQGEKGGGEGALRAAWLELVDLCRAVTDRALALTLTTLPPSAPPPPSALAPPGQRVDEVHGGAEAAAAEAACAAEAGLKACRRLGGDLSVAYALHYPNEEGGAAPLPLHLTDGERGINVKAHVDPSLLVVEPVSDVPGLDVLDQALLRRRDQEEAAANTGGRGPNGGGSNSCWVSVERACAGRAGQDWVLFGGRGLERATKGRVAACVHRVTAPDFHSHLPAARPSPRRFCFIFEQKLSDFYDEC